MILYEYDHEDIGLTDRQRQLAELGMVKVEDLSAKIKDIINKRAKDGWEPFYPFSVPLLWFKRVAIKKSKKN